jgi:peptidyl-prolyl cis-trans isomerase D
MEANKVSFAYVAALYSTIKTQQVTDAEIMDYMKKTKRNLKQMKLVK